MAVVIPTMGPTATPLHTGYHMPVSMNEAGRVVNAPLVGVAREAVNFQPILSLPAHVMNMVAGFNPRVLIGRKS